MNKKKNLVFFLILILLVNCSFDTKTGIWTGEKTEKKKVVELEKVQIRKKNIEKIYSIGNVYSLEKTLAKKIILSKPKKKLIMENVWSKSTKFPWKYLFIRHR